jgi:alpha-galactosidase
MGVNMWGGFGFNVTDADVRGQADVLISSGMKTVGYEYALIDDVWEGKRDEKGFIHPNERLRDIKALADYVHSKGLKLGLYSSPGPKTCNKLEGSLGHEEQDAQTYADWGIDYLKYDCCSFGDLTKTGKVLPFQAPNPDFDASVDIAGYKKMGEALKKTGRPILYALCQYGMDRVWSWGASVGGNMWRTTIDNGDKWDSTVEAVGFGQNGLERFAGPGHWNDPDMLYMLGGMKVEEYRTQMSLWCLLAAPIIVCNDLRKLSPEEMAILTNPEVVAVDQDPAGIQGHRVAQEGPLEVWMKPLADGSKAVGLFNRQYTLPSPLEPVYADRSVQVTVHFRDIGVGETAAVRDLWARKDLGTFKDSYTAPVDTHGVVMIKVR